MTAQKRYDLHIKSLELAVLAVQGNRPVDVNLADFILDTAFEIETSLLRAYEKMQKITG